VQSRKYAKGANCSTSPKGANHPLKPMVRGFFSKKL